VRGVRATWPWHPEADDTSWLCLQRAHVTLQRIRLLVPVSVLGLWLLLGEVIQELWRPLPVKSVVFDDGLLFSVFPAAGTLPIQGLGCVSLLVPDEAISTRPSPFPALISLRGPRPLDINIGALRHPLTGGYNMSG
jgi:hypothetical protein